MNEIVFPQFAVRAADHWFDVTAELEDENSPSTLTKEEGHGDLQVSIADLSLAGRPQATLDELRKLLKEFSQAHDLSSPNNIVTEESPRPLLAGNFIWDDDFLRVWYVSENGKLAFITYTCDRGATFAAELTEVELIVRSLRFV